MVVWLEALRLKRLVRALSSRSDIFDRVELVLVPGGFFTNIAPANHDPIISQESVTGFSHNPDISFSKAISERIERLAFVNGRADGLASCQTESSDGFAAFPIVLRTRTAAKMEARQRALSEAVERFVWAKWWDNPKIGATIRNFQSVSSNFSISKQIVEKIPTPFSIEKIHLVEPKHNGIFKVFILACEMSNGGFVSGGACGKPGQEKETMNRAAAELFRHGLAAKRLADSGVPPSSFYQNRLYYFAFESGGDLVRKRIEALGNEVISLPSLSIDCEVPHKHQDLICVYRCLFKEQPPFIGGILERFCL
jgi:hypothetical protein